MAIRSFKYFREQAGAGVRKTVAVAAAQDAHTIEATLRAAQEGILDYVLVGQAREILDICKSLGYEARQGCVLNASSDEEAARIAVDLVRSGQADFLQKGLLQTAVLLKSVVDKESGISQGRAISHIALLEMPGYPKIVGITDGGMIPYPDLEEKEAIVKNAVEMFHGFGYEKPMVAALGPAETVNPKIQETKDAAALKEMAAQGAFGQCYVEGPVSLDLAVNRESAQIKGYHSPISGQVDIFLVPNISCGNIMAKTLMEFAQAKMAGCVLGAKCPIALNSRSASFEEKYDSLMACAQMLTGSQRDDSFAEGGNSI